MVRLTASARKKFICSKSVKTPQRSIKYKQPAYPDDEVLHMDHIAPVGQKLLSAAVVITVAKSHILRDTSILSFLDWFSGQSQAPDLRYLEFCGVYQDLLYGRQLDHITLRRPKLEIVTTNADPLPQDDEDTREDATDSEEERRVARKARKTHRKTRDMRRQIRNLGKQRSMSMIMGREIYGFEMGKSFRGDLDYSDDDDDDDDDDVDPRKMKQELKMMEEGFGFDD
ncbi:uncharacterized protein CC84DRAFT_1172312 [Paraphaeosphaeria sporulosa]|uniref:Uncharacterized protein n=1 Tax=Paraphaeosphaeria sporulosa TaxID=1460663 RepID=A0A177CQL7_9PLEO|nr:uncharacterized protein CC84DRAFT_1172312 [Paraphaeosphaeria sporulosa]OAG09805.1 hypothetical protein CC84DRAFT_1172312 [Paraphaeosphaeria sporulosa]